jgi:5-methylcytosine-specific restriction enzyme subunit McrC
MNKPIRRYEYGHLKIGEEGFTKVHWEAFVKLNTIHEGEYFEVLHNGLRFKQYLKNTANVKALKGKLEFSGNIRHNLVHKERFYTNHQVYDVDHQLHQILAVALNIVSRFTKGTRLINSVALSFPEVKPIAVTATLFDKLQLNRKSSHYRYALELARLIILNYSPDIKGGKEKMLSLLFDMNVLWEAYVLVKLKQFISQKNLWYSVYNQ